MCTVAFVLVRHRSPLDLWNVYDARWYTGIAGHGYHWTLDGKQALAFFPLYPAVIHLGMAAGIPAIMAGLIVANGAGLAALFYIRALVLDEWGPPAARRAVWLVALFPTAFFTFAPYTEALFMLAASAVLYHARRGQTVAAGVWLAAAVLTRSTAVILLAPLLMSIVRIRRDILITVFGPAICAWAGYVAYLIWQHLSLGDVIASEGRWHRSLTLPWTGFTASLHYLMYHFGYNSGWTVENLLQMGVTILLLGLTLAAWRQLPPSFAMYCAGFWAIVLCTPEWRDGYFAPFSSVDRFVLALFPLAGWAADRIAPRLLRAWLIISAALMTGAAAVHIGGGWVG